MKNIDDRQREMRERNHQKKQETMLSQSKTADPNDSPEVVKLKNQISELEQQVFTLQRENHRLREQKTIVVERPGGQGKSYSDSVKEQQHNFFKYSNARRGY